MTAAGVTASGAVPNAPAAIPQSPPAAAGRYTQALEACPGAGSAYMVFSNLSAAHLQLGQKQEALAAARRAVEGAPRGFHKVLPRRRAGRR